MPPTGGDELFPPAGVNGEKIAFAVEGLGWRLAAHFEGVSFPDGVVATSVPSCDDLQEIGLIAEHGACYLCFSGGLLPLPSGLEGGVSVRRLRTGRRRRDPPPL